MKNTSIIPNHVSETLIFNRATGWREDMPAYIEPGTRVLCLYRVSTDKQLYHTEDNEADIPMQRKRCRKYCESMNWTIVCELQEEGVSGHKVRAENRDKIQQIKECAKQGKFDILLVFMFDRIGRISDETPFVPFPKKQTQKKLRKPNEAKEINRPAQSGKQNAREPATPKQSGDANDYKKPQCTQKCRPEPEPGKQNAAGE